MKTKKLVSALLALMMLWCAFGAAAPRAGFVSAETNAVKAEPGMAMITLKVDANAANDPMAGIQMYLDSTGKAYGVAFNDYGLGATWGGPKEMTDEMRSKFDNVIPKGATGKMGDIDNVVVNGETVSIKVPAGTYDYVIIYNDESGATPPTNYAPASGGKSLPPFEDDFTVAAGKNYVFEIGHTPYHATFNITRTEEEMPDEPDPTTPPAAGDQTMITLKVPDGVFDVETTGEQIYFDKNCDTYGDIYKSWGFGTFAVPQDEMTDEQRARFAYSLPENATGKKGDITHAVTNGNTVSVKIPAGKYDYVIVRNEADYSNMELDQSYYYDDGEYTATRGDDVDFLAGKNYIFEMIRDKSDSAFIKLTVEDMPAEATPTPDPMQDFKTIIWDFEQKDGDPFSEEGGWTSYDQDGDGAGFIWAPTNKNKDSNLTLASDPGHGSGVVYSESKGKMPNNWLISPEFLCGGRMAVTLASATKDKENVDVCIREKGQEEWTVLRSGIKPPLDSQGFGYPQEYTFEIPEYAGKTVQIAFHHYNSIGIATLSVDYVRILKGASATPVPETPKPTDRPQAGTDIVWNFDDGVDPVYYGWKTENHDDDEYNWLWIKEGTLTTYNGNSRVPAYDGAGSMISESNISRPGIESRQLDPDNYLISPVFYAGDRAGAYVRTLDPKWPDKLTIYYKVGTGTWQPAVEISYRTLEGGEYQEYSFDTSKYKGQDMQIMFRHHDSKYGYAIAVDHVFVDAEYVPPTAAPTPMSGSVEANPDYATVILTVEKDTITDGTGFVMLLDADADSFGKGNDVNGTFYNGNGAFWTQGNLPESVLKRFEYRIPQEFDGKMDSKDVIVEGYKFLTVADALYDYAIINPDSHPNQYSDEGMAYYGGSFLAGSVEGAGDDLWLQKGKVYEFYIHSAPQSVQQSGVKNMIDLYVDGELYKASDLPKPTQAPATQNPTTQAPTTDAPGTSNPTTDPGETEVPGPSAIPAPPAGQVNIVLRYEAYSENIVVAPEGWIMLIDTDHNAYGRLWDPSKPLVDGGDIIPQSIFSAFEHKIPEYADNNILAPAGTVKPGESAMITIDAGKCDFTFVNPAKMPGYGGMGFLPDDHGGIKGSQDDFEFVAGRTYVFTIHDEDIGGGDIVPVVDCKDGTEQELPSDAPVNEVWNFEDNPWEAGWKTEQGESDADEYNWTWIEDVNNNEIGRLPANDGQGIMVSQSYVNGTEDGTPGFALNPDNWLISPAFLAGTYVSAKVTSLNVDYPETLGVYISTDDGKTWKPAVEDYTVSNTLGKFNEVLVDTHEYYGTEIRIAFRHYNSADRFILALDSVVAYANAEMPTPTPVPPVTPTPTPTEVPPTEVPTEAPTADPGVPGDATGDREVTMDDALNVMRHAIGVIVLNEDAQKRCDMDNDGFLRVADALTIARMSMGL